MKQRFALATLAITIAASVFALAVPAGAQVVHTPPDANACKHGGWRGFTNDHGDPFTNQGRCVAFARHHQHVVGLDDLTGSFTGTQFFEFGGPFVPCSFVHQVFDATYPGSAAVGTVTLNIDGCVLLAGSAICCFDGTFTMTTTAGSITGTATGPLTDGIDFDLTLTVTSGTGPFSATAGQTLHDFMHWDGNTPGVVTGTVTVP